MRMTRTVIPVTLVCFLASFLLACGGSSSDDSGPFFNPSRADRLAHEALVVEADLPGSGWEVTARDEAEDAGESDFLDMAKAEPACAQLASLAALGDLGGIFGGSGEADGAPAGRAQVELQRPGAGGFLPVSLEVEVEIEQTVTEVQSGSQLAKGLLESDQTKNCIARVVNTMMKDQLAASGLQMTLEPRPSARPAPHDGATMGFLMSIRLPGVIALDAVMDMYFWSYGNGSVNALMFGPKEDMTPALIADLLKAVDEKVIKAEKAQ